MRVLITRSREGNARLAEMLLARGHEPVRLDLLSFNEPADWGPLEGRLRRLREYSWLAFTSATGAEAFIRRARVLGLLTRWKPPPKIAAVGPGTARALESGGVKVDFLPTRFLTSALGMELPGSGRVLLLRAKEAKRRLLTTLRRRGFEVDEVPVYGTGFEPIRDIRQVESADVVMFGSPSAVRGLCSQLPADRLARIVMMPAACMGPVTAKAARSWGFTRIIQPETHTFDSLLSCLNRMVTTA